MFQDKSFMKDGEDFMKNGDTKTLEKCEFCGKLFMPNRKGHTYCTEKCSRLAGYKRRKVKKRPGETECKTCGRWFKAEHGGTKYCSMECRNKKREMVIAAEAAAKAEKMVACKNCGELFMPKHTNQKYCSRKCNAFFHAPEERKAECAKIKIIKPVPVDPEYLPEIGMVYEAERSFGTTQKFWIIRNLNGKDIVVRTGEAEEIVEDVACG